MRLFAALLGCGCCAGGSVALALVLLLQVVQTGLLDADSGCSITKHLVHGMMQWPPATIAVTKGELGTNWNITDP